MRLIVGDHDGFLPKSRLDDWCVFHKCYHAMSTHPIGWTCQCPFVAHSLIISRSNLPASAASVAKCSDDGLSGMMSAASHRRCADLLTPPTAALWTSVRPHDHTDNDITSLRSTTRSANS